MIDSKHLIFAPLFAALTAVGGFISVPLPFSPVPVTLQTFFVLLAGLLLGPVYAIISILLYIIVGILGVPVFAMGTSGLGVLIGPSGGYLIGFIIATIVVGYIAQEFKRNFFVFILACLLGTALIYVFGVLWLSYVAKMTLVQAFIVGAIPFIIGDVIKLVLASLVASKFNLQNYLRR